MKTLLRLLMTGMLLLLTQGFAQEPQRAVIPQRPVGATPESGDQTIAAGTSKRPVPVVLPKALPELNPSLAEIARAARAARAAAQKAQVVVADDTQPQK
jgi:hypothetical protein